MPLPPNSIKRRAYELIHELPDNLTWRDVIDSAIARMDLDEASEEQGAIGSAAEEQSSQKFDA